MAHCPITVSVDFTTHLTDTHNALLYRSYMITIIHFQNVSNAFVHLDSTLYIHTILFQFTLPVQSEYLQLVCKANYSLLHLWPLLLTYLSLIIFPPDLYWNDVLQSSNNCELMSLKCLFSKSKQMLR